MNVIGITGTGSLIGQAVIKSIKHSSFKNAKLIGMDYLQNTIGSFWVDKNYLITPHIQDKNTNELDWLAKIISIIDEQKVQILFIGVDFELHYFAKYKQVIFEETSCVVVVSSQKAIDIADDKYKTYQFLKNNHLYYPTTFLPHEISDALTQKKAYFPLIVKPRNGWRSINVFVVHNEMQLAEKINQVKECIIQEHIGDSSTEYTCGVIAFGSDVKTSIALKRDLRDGNTVTTYYQKDFPSTINQYVESVAKRIDQFGSCNFQLRLDNAGIPKIFEINARHSGTTYIRSLYGFNEIEYIIEYILNNREVQFTLKEGIVKRYFEEMLIES